MCVIVPEQIAHQGKLFTIFISNSKQWLQNVNKGVHAKEPCAEAQDFSAHLGISPDLQKNPKSKLLSLNLSLWDCTTSLPYCKDYFEYYFILDILKTLYQQTLTIHT